MRFDAKRVLILAAALAAIAFLVVEYAEEPPAPSAPASRALPGERDNASSGGSVEMRLPERRNLAASPLGDPFAAQTWAPPPPPPKPAVKPPPAAAPAPPAPPPNPYRFAGSAMHEGELKIFVADGDRVFEARPGEELDKGFRVESVTPQAVVLTGPQNARYTLEVTSTLIAQPGEAQRDEGAARGATAGVGK